MISSKGVTGPPSWEGHIRPLLHLMWSSDKPRFSDASWSLEKEQLLCVESWSLRPHVRDFLWPPVSLGFGSVSRKLIPTGKGGFQAMQSLQEVTQGRLHTWGSESLFRGKHPLESLL